MRGILSTTALIAGVLLLGATAVLSPLGRAFGLDLEAAIGGWITAALVAVTLVGGVLWWWGWKTRNDADG